MLKKYILQSTLQDYKDTFGDIAIDIDLGI